MSRSLPRFLLVCLAAFLLVSPAQVDAGVFKNLFDKIGKTVEDYNRDMWTGENSVGATAWKHEGGFNKTFTNTVAALSNAQSNAAANVKEVWKAVKDIVLWLPRKIQAAFNKVMDKVRAFGDKLNAMNQGATVKERWKNLVGGGGGGGGAQAFSAPAGGGFEPAAPESEPAFEDSGDLDTDELGALLSEDAGPRASVSADEDEELPPEDVSDILAELDARPSDAPGAPSSSAGDASAFGKMFRLSSTITKSSQRSEAHKRVRIAYITTLDKALRSRNVQTAADLIKGNAALYKGNPDGMEKAMGLLAKRHKRYSKSLNRASKRMANMSRQSE